jgi:hypothetical protein
MGDLHEFQWTASADVGGMRRWVEEGHLAEVMEGLEDGKHERFGRLVISCADFQATDDFALAGGDDPQIARLIALTYDVFAWGELAQTDDVSDLTEFGFVEPIEEWNAAKRIEADGSRHGGLGCGGRDYLVCVRN